MAKKATSEQALKINDNYTKDVRETQHVGMSG
jgi:hypothetical protein